MALIPAEIAAIRSNLVKDLVGKLQPVASAQKGADVLQNLTPGQRVLATIQEQLPDGTYRATINGRSLTLALPFAAQPGESLELETVEQNGKTALAVVTNRAAEEGAGKEAEKAGNASVSTRLTPTGKLIAELLAGMDKEGGKRPPSLQLNNAQPLFERFPGKAVDIVPALREALGKSGMFYEAHQARWVQGKATLESLLSEPQGRLSPVAQILKGMGAPSEAAAQGKTPTPLPTQTNQTNTAAQNQASAMRPTLTAASHTPAQTAQTAQATPQAATPTTTQTGHNTAATGTSGGSPAETGAVRVGQGQAIAPDLAPVVRQQLESLATNTYIWQGQIWPGQTMDWEIVEEDGGQERREENTAANWTTRLRLRLPQLGALEAVLKLSGGKKIQITLRTENDAARIRLVAANADLRRRFEASGLSLEFLDVARTARHE